MKHNNKKDIYKWIDGELKGARKRLLEAHLRACLACQKETESMTVFHKLLKSSSIHIEPSETFEADFWRKVQAITEESWSARFIRFIQSFESMPVPNLAQSFAIALLAVFIGSTSGVLSSKVEWSQVSGNGAPTLSGVNEYKGIPKVSLAGSYLAMVEPKES